MLGVIGLLGTVFTMWTWYSGLPTRRLSFAVAAERSVLVTPQNQDGLKVSFQDMEITNEHVFVARMAVWNAGTQAIRPENVLEPVRIAWSNDARLLTARVVKGERDLIKPSLDVSTAAEGHVGVSWAIMERDDGFWIELVMAGSPTAAIQLKGVVEGKAGIQGRDDGRKRPPNVKWSWPQRFGLTFITLLALAVLWFGLRGMERALSGSQSVRHGVARAIAWAAAILVWVGGIFVFAWIDSRFLRPWPPFEKAAWVDVGSTSR